MACFAIDNVGLNSDGTPFAVRIWDSPLKKQLIESLAFDEDNFWESDFKSLRESYLISVESAFNSNGVESVHDSSLNKVITPAEYIKNIRALLTRWQKDLNFD